MFVCIFANFFSPASSLSTLRNTAAVDAFHQFMEFTWYIVLSFSFLPHLPSNLMVAQFQQWFRVFTIGLIVYHSRARAMARTKSLVLKAQSLAFTS